MWTHCVCIHLMLHFDSINPSFVGKNENQNLWGKSSLVVTSSLWFGCQNQLKVTAGLPSIICVLQFTIRWHPQETRLNCHGRHRPNQTSSFPLELICYGSIIPTACYPFVLVSYCSLRVQMHVYISLHNKGMCLYKYNLFLHMLLYIWANLCIHRVDVWAYILLTCVSSKFGKQ